MYSYVVGGVLCPHIGGDFTATMAFVLHAYIPILLPSDFVLFFHTAFSRFGAFLQHVLRKLDIPS